MSGLKSAVLFFYGAYCTYNTYTISGFSHLKNFDKWISEYYLSVLGLKCFFSLPCTLFQLALPSLQLYAYCSDIYDHEVKYFIELCVNGNRKYSLLGLHFSLDTFLRFMHVVVFQFTLPWLLCRVRGCILLWKDSYRPFMNSTQSYQAQVQLLWYVPISLLSNTQLKLI